MQNPCHVTIKDFLTDVLSGYLNCPHVLSRRFARVCFVFLSKNLHFNDDLKHQAADWSDLKIILKLTNDS